MCRSVSAASCTVARGMIPGSLSAVRSSVAMTNINKRHATTGMAAVNRGVSRRQLMQIQSDHTTIYYCYLLLIYYRHCTHSLKSIQLTLKHKNHHHHQPHPSASGLKSADRPLSLNRFSTSAYWKHRPGHPHGWLVDQLHQDSHSPADIQRSTIRKGHSVATLQSLLTVHYQPPV